MLNVISRDSQLGEADESRDVRSTTTQPEQPRATYRRVNQYLQTGNEGQREKWPATKLIQRRLEPRRFVAVGRGLSNGRRREAIKEGIFDQSYSFGSQSRANTSRSCASTPMAAT